jgi:hypothetical protein
MAKIELNNDQLRLIQNALELYSRIGILHFDVMLDHPSIDNLIDNQYTTVKELEVGDETMRGEIVEIGDGFIKTKGRWGNGEEIKTWTDIENIKLSPDWSRLHQKRDIIKNLFNELKRHISGFNLGNGGNLGIHNKYVDKSCREAFDIVQIIRHEFWKENEDRSTMTVDSSVSLTTSQEKIKVKLDDIKDIRKQKLNKLKK